MYASSHPLHVNNVALPSSSYLFFPHAYIRTWYSAIQYGMNISLFNKNLKYCGLSAASERVKLRFEFHVIKSSRANDEPFATLFVTRPLSLLIAATATAATFISEKPEVYR